MTFLWHLAVQPTDMVSPKRAKHLANHVSALQQKRAIGYTLSVERLAIMGRTDFLALLSLGLITAAPASATTFSVVSGTRGAQIASNGPIGESFIATDGILNSFGFQFANANAGQPNSDVTFTLLSAAGDVIVTRSATLPTYSGRGGNWYDFDLGTTSVTSGASYTALVSTSSSLLALIFGPTSTPGADAYAGGALISAKPIDSYCSTSGACDANFRFTSTAAPGAVPELATWAMMVAGFGLVGAGCRRRQFRNIAKPAY